MSDVHWFRHDLDSSTGRKFIKLRIRAGYEGIGLYWTVAEHIYRASGCYPFATDDDKQLLADTLHISVEKLLDFVSICESCENLLEIKNGLLGSKRINEELKTKRKVSVSRAISGSKGGKQKASNALANASPDSSSTDRQTDVIQTDKQTKSKYLDHVFLSDKEHQKFQSELGTEVLNRCIEKLDSWIESDPTIKRKRNGKNAAATFRSWVINAVAEEQARASRLNGNTPKTTNFDRNVENILGGFEK